MISEFGDMRERGPLKIASRPCVACGSARQKPYGSLPRGQYLRCTRCGLVCQDGSVPYEETQQHYEKPNPEWDVESFDDLPYRFRQAPVSVFSKIRQYKSQPCAVLDVGCYRGFLLEYFRLQGWADLTGIEPAASAVRFGRERFGLRLLEGTLDDYVADEAHGLFDVVLVIQVIEHTPDPAAFLDSVKRVMKPGGILLVELPHFGGPNLWFKPLFSTLGLGRAPWHFLDFPKHVFDFPARSFATLLNRRGFRILEWSVRSKARETDEPILRAARRVKGRLHWGSTMQFVADVRRES